MQASLDCFLVHNFSTLKFISDRQMFITLAYINYKRKYILSKDGASRVHS